MHNMYKNLYRILYSISIENFQAVIYNVFIKLERSCINMDDEIDMEWYNKNCNSKFNTQLFYDAVQADDKSLLMLLSTVVNTYGNGNNNKERGEKYDKD